MFKDFAAGNKKAIHPNIRASVYSIVLHNGGENEYDIILNEYRTAKNADERNTALRSLGRARGENLMHRTLALPLSDEVKGQDIYLPIAGMRSSPEGIEALWTWMKDNWSALEKKCPPGLTMLGTMVQMCTSSFATPQQAEDVKAFFKERSTKGFDRALSQSLDSISARGSWLERDREDVRGWLEKEGLVGKGGEGKL